MIFWGKAEDFNSSSYRAFYAAAREMRGKFVFVTVHSEKDTTGQITNYFGLKHAPSPAVSSICGDKGGSTCVGCRR